AGYPAITNCRPFNHAATANCPSVYVTAIGISPNGQTVATIGSDYRLKIWNFDGRTLTAAGTVLTTNSYSHASIAFTPDGTRMVFTDGPVVRTYTVNGWTAGTMLMGDGGNDTLTGLGLTPD